MCVEVVVELDLEPAFKLPQSAGGEGGMGVYGRRGFTRDVLYVLSGKLNRVSEDFLYGTVTAKELLEAVKHVPPANLEDRQNESPKLKYFVEVAEKEPRALFEVYVVTDVRDDERLTVDGVLIPRDRPDLIYHVMKKALAAPDEFDVVLHNGIEYIRMWWD
jgi:hypothetical protein